MIYSCFPVTPAVELRLRKKRAQTNVFISRKTGISNVIIPCLTKLGQNIFSSEKKAFTEWLDSLNENSLYKALLDAHTATCL